MPPADVSAAALTHLETADDAAPAPDGREPSHGPARPRTGRRTVVVLAIALLAAVASLGVLGYRTFEYRSDGVLRAEAVDTAREYAIAMSSFDFQNLDANRDTIVGMSTGDFADRYVQMVDALSGVVTDGQGRATATADHVAVESIDGATAVVLVFADQQATNVTAPEGNSQKYRMVISMVRDGDRWLVDNVETV